MKRTTRICVLLSAVASMFVLTSAWAATHPLDPLSKDEIAQAVAVIKGSGKAPAAAEFYRITLVEPSKAEVLAYKPGGRISRSARALVYDRAKNKSYEAIILLGDNRVTSWREAPDAQPPIGAVDFKEAADIVRADPGWQAAMRKRGIMKFDEVQVDAWSSGYFARPDETGFRAARAFSYVRGESLNPYARPIDGVVAYVNLTDRKVYRLIDYADSPVPMQPSDFDPKSIGAQRKAPAPLKIVQPNGPGFELRGNEVQWQNWRFRVGVTPREGVVLHEVAYDDHGTVRPIIYRASLAEMVVPYGSPAEGWYVKNAFDEGEYGVGELFFPLVPAVDVPENAAFLEASFANPDGSARTVSNAIAIYERDAGMLWKHVDFFTGKNQSRRARQLVVFAVATVGNYEYGFEWVFHQDGVVDMNVVLTGIIQARGASTNAANGKPDGASRYGEMVAPGIEGVNHQHFFSMRLDMDVDGERNSVFEWNDEAAPAGASNPHGNAWSVSKTLLQNEEAAQRHMNMDTNRRWQVANESKKNAVGQPVSYVLMPMHNVMPYLAPETYVRKRAGLLNSHLWVTRFDPDELYAAGEHVNQSKGGDGLPSFMRDNQRVANEDVVVWYTMGTSHAPRPEEWPVMTGCRVGFSLIPTGFFARNPALDVPPPAQ
jgi:primary-amine oxidase